MLFHFESLSGIFKQNKPASLSARSSIFIFIENISTNFNPFYGLIANKRTNIVVTHKTTVIQLSYATIFGVFYAKKQSASLCARNNIFIFIETLWTNFNQFYGINANQRINTMVTYSWYIFITIRRETPATKRLAQKVYSGTFVTVAPYIN